MKYDVSTNIVPLINFVMTSMPQNLTDLEKVRYIYIELGKIFSYDYRIIADESVVEEKVDYENNSIGRFKTCYQISEILAIIINGMIPDVKAKMVERKIDGRRFNHEHVGVEVAFNDGLKILLDLTLDLANIQSGMKTKEFGFTTDAECTYDIISLRECEQMDKKIGFITEKYTDDYIEEFKTKINQTNFDGFTPAEVLDFKITHMKEELLKSFYGTHEATRYI